MEISENLINDDPVMVPVIVPDPVPEPEPETGSSVSENNTEEIINDEEEKALSENVPAPQIIKENFTYNSVTETVEVSSNVVIDPNDLVSVNSVSLNVLSADGLSLNSVSVNVSSNYVSNNTIQIISADSTPFWDKPFEEYTVSEGLLFIIMVSLVLGFVSSHLLKGLRNYGNF